MNTAKKRWALLADVILRKPVDTTENDISTRRFESFGLLQTRFPASNNNNDGDAIDDEVEEVFAPAIDQSPRFRLARADAGAPTLDELRGFDNTGNVCVWPSEEVLAFYLLGHAQSFALGRVVELGAGRSGVAGAAAAAAGADRVLLTDGNERAVRSLDRCVAVNAQLAGRLSARRLRWACSDDYAHLRHSFDTVLAADCLLFEDGRAALLETVAALLRRGGRAIICAPLRSGTFAKFEQLCEQSGYFASITRLAEYDKFVTSCHTEHLKNDQYYVPNLHYPLMLQLSK